MWRIVSITLLIIKYVLGEYQPYSVALGTKPTVQRIPDLSILTEADYKCFSTEKNLACTGYNFYLPISGYYGYSKSDFATYVNTEITNDTGYIKATCPNANVKHDITKIAYRYSVYCGRLMYSQVRWCKENDDFYKNNPQLLLCKRTCMEYAQSIIDYGTTVCGDNTQAQKIAKNIVDKWCSLFTDDDGCIEGIESETKNCGYSSASLSKEAYTFNPSNSCWGQPDKIEEVNQKASEEESQEIKMGAIKWKVIYPIILMVIITAITFFFYQKQKKLYLTGYSNLKDPEPEYEIIPSEAKPSRDYVLPEDLEAPVAAANLPRKSSFAVRTLQRAATTKSNKSNVLYMIAIYNYHAKMDDELELKAGDRIRVEHKYNDGWAAGINETTNKFGAFPLICCSDNISSNQSQLPSRTKSRIRKGNSIRVRSSEYSRNIGEEGSSLLYRSASHR